MSGIRIVVAAALIFIVSVAPLSGWPFGRASVVAQASTLWPFSSRTVSASNENEQRDQENRREQRENDNHDDNEDSAPPPPPRQVNVPPPPPPPPDQVSRCLQNGDSITLAMANGGVTAKVFQNNLAIELAQVDPATVPAPPGGALGGLIFRLGISGCGGGTQSTELNLGVSYAKGAAAGHDESKLALMFYDGHQWTTAPKSAADPGHNYVSASVTAPGVYALAQP